MRLLWIRMGGSEGGMRGEKGRGEKGMGEKGMGEREGREGRREEDTKI